MASYVCSVHVHKPRTEVSWFERQNEKRWTNITDRCAVPANAVGYKQLT